MKKTLLVLFLLNFQFGCSPSSYTNERSLDKIAPNRWSTATASGNQNSDYNQTYWIEQVEDPNLTKAVKKAWVSNPNLLATLNQTLL